MPHAAFVMSPGQDWSLRELAETVRYELELQGVPSSLHLDGFPAPRPGLVYVLVGPRQVLELEGDDSVPPPPVLKRTVTISDEPPDTAAEGSRAYLELLRRAGAVFDTHVRSVLALHRAGIAARTLRPGYSKLRDRFEPEVERPIAVTFYGTASARRLRLLSQSASVLARHNCLIQLADGSSPNPVGSPSYLAESKWDLLSRSQVLVNLHAGDRPHLEFPRMLEAIHCGAVFVTEDAAGFTPFEPGEHLLVASPDALPYVVEEVLRDTELQQRIREQAYERLKSWLPFALSIGVLRAALVEVVGNPITDGTSMGRRYTASVGSDGRLREQQPIASSDPPAPALEALQDSLRTAHMELLDVRRQLRILQAVQREEPSPAVRVVHQNGAWAARRAPALSALVTLGDDAELLRHTLDAYGHSWASGRELIIAGPANAVGRGDPLAVALQWVQRHPRIPSLVVVQQVDSGLAASRNLALEHARAPCCLVLDPGYELYPRALAVLTGTLNGLPDVALVYPIVQRRAPATDEGVELTSYYGWEPDRLRLAKLVEGPYVVRTEVLLGLGGFTTNLALSGWEDHDLLCRMAERGINAQLVPQILARGRHINWQRRFPEASPAGPALVERAPRLLAGLA